MKVKKLAAICLSGALTASLLTGCGINKNAAAATFGDGTVVTMGVANFTMRYEQASMDELYRYYFGDDVWSSYEDSVKDSVMDSLHEMYTLKMHMADYNVSLTDEETAAITEAAAAFMAANSSDTLKELGATQEIVEEMLSLYTIQTKMTAAIKAEADTEVSDEEANMRAYTMLTFSTSGTYDSDYNYVELTDDEIAEVQAEAESVYAQITSPDELEAVAEANDKSTTTGTYAADNTSLDEAVKTALDALKEGEMSELITGDSGYYIVRIDAETDEEATESNRESIIEDRQNDLYDEVLAGWQENDGWTVKTKQIEKIEFKNTFTAPEEESTEDTESTEEADAVSEDAETAEDEETEAEETISTEETVTEEAATETETADTEAEE